MSTLYQEPIRAHLSGGAVDQPILFAGITDDNRAIVVFGDGVMGMADLSSVSVDWRFDDKGDRWRMLEDMEGDETTEDDPL